MSTLQGYLDHFAHRGYQPDPAQLLALKRLSVCQDEWNDYREQRSTSFKRILLRPDVPRGVYLWGGVGRGKSFLMDCFYHVVTVRKKTRVHFHEFMRGIHQQLEKLKGVADPLDEVARRIAIRHRLICFDEFHISDIADAMILYRLLDGLLRNRVGFVMTSNYAPDLLYPDGLHRDRILPAIALLKQNLDVVNVDGGIDYRQRVLEQVKIYHTPLNTETQSALEEAFDTLAEMDDESIKLVIAEREIFTYRRAGSIVWFNFQDICGGPRSQEDYLEIAAQFHTVIISGIPKMTATMASEARRFTWLVDIFYDRKIKLLVSAEVSPETLYTQGVYAHEFQRTVSRLIEMQSREYLDSPWKVTT